MGPKHNSLQFKYWSQIQFGSLFLAHGLHRPKTITSFEGRSTYPRGNTNKGNKRPGGEICESLCFEGWVHKIVSSLPGVATWLVDWGSGKKKKKTVKFIYTDIEQHTKNPYTMLYLKKEQKKTLKSLIIQRLRAILNPRLQVSINLSNS